MAKNKRLRQQKSNKQKGKNSPIANVLIISWIEKYLYRGTSCAPRY